MPVCGAIWFLSGAVVAIRQPSPSPACRQVGFPRNFAAGIIANARVRWAFLFHLDRSMVVYCGRQRMYPLGTMFLAG